MRTMATLIKSAADPCVFAKEEEKEEEEEDQKVGQNNNFTGGVFVSHKGGVTRFTWMTVLTACVCMRSTSLCLPRSVRTVMSLREQSRCTRSLNSLASRYLVFK